MLREVPNARFVAGFGRRRLVIGERVFPTMSRRAHRALWRVQEERPVEIAGDGVQRWWLFRGRVFRDDDDLTDDEVFALLRERERRRERRIAHAVDLMRAEQARGRRREPIPEDVRRAVFRRDGGRCVACGSAELLQFDHVIPVALGGASSLENLQLLCAPCNRAKGDAL